MSDLTDLGLPERGEFGVYRVPVSMMEYEKRIATLEAENARLREELEANRIKKCVHDLVKEWSEDTTPEYDAARKEQI